MGEGTEGWNSPLLLVGISISVEIFNFKFANSSVEIAGRSVDEISREKFGFDIASFKLFQLDFVFAPRRGVREMNFFLVKLLV